MTVNGLGGGDTFTVDLNGVADLTTLTLNGGDDADTFVATSQSTVTLNVAGGDPTGTTGDTLSLDLAGAIDPSLTASRDVAGINGAYTFDNFADVNFRELEALTPAAIIGGMAFDDVNGDGFRDLDEEGLADVTVTLDANADGIIDQTATTADDGTFEFFVEPGRTVRVRATAPTGCVQTSDDPADFASTNGTVVTDFGFAGRGGPLFLDLNGNEVQDEGERPLPGRLVFRDLNDNGTLDDSEPTATTDANGNFDLPGPGQVRQFLFPGDSDGGISSPTRFNSTVAVIPVVDDLFQAAGSANERFVRSLYRGVLGREAEQSGLDNFLSLLAQGMTAQVADAIWKCAEHRAQQVAGSYRDYLGREGSAAEVVGCVAAFLAGATEEDVVVGFLASAKFMALYPDDSAFVGQLYVVLLGRFRGEGEGPQSEGQVQSLGRAGFVRVVLAQDETRFRAIDAFYVGLLNREGEQAGRQNWLSNLAAGTTTYGSTAVQFLAGGEFLTKAASV